MGSRHRSGGIPTHGEKERKMLREQNYTANIESEMARVNRSVQALKLKTRSGSDHELSYLLWATIKSAANRMVDEAQRMMDAHAHDQLREIPIGPVTTGTLKLEDLLEAFEFMYRTYKLDHDRDLAYEARRLGNVLKFELTEADEEETTSRAQDILDALICELADMAPDGCYFGGQEGDPTVIGFWQTEEAEL